MIHPGPQSIEPGEMPGGLVFHFYAVPDDRGPDARLVRVSRVGLDEVEATAELDAVALELVPGDLCLVVFDGDSGLRWPGSLVRESWGQP